LAGGAAFQFSVKLSYLTTTNRPFHFRLLRTHFRRPLTKSQPVLLDKIRTIHSTVLLLAMAGTLTNEVKLWTSGFDHWQKSLTGSNQKRQLTRTKNQLTADLRSTMC
jgi:hypothetical protein